MATEPDEAHPGGGFNPPEPTTSGGPDYGRFIDAVRTLQDHARGADAPDDVITEAADLIEAVTALLAPVRRRRVDSPSGRRMDLPNRGNILQVPGRPHDSRGRPDRGTARFRRFHLGRNGAVHGGSVAHAVRLGARLRRRSAQPAASAAHRVPARQLPQDRADRQGAAGRRRASTESRAARSSSQADSSTATTCSPTPRRCSCKLQAGPAVKTTRPRRSRGGRRSSAGGRAGATGCATGRPPTSRYRIVVGVVGLAVLAVGIVAIPYPGPRLGDRLRRARHPGHRVRLGPAAAGVRQSALRHGDGVVPAGRACGCRRSARPTHGGGRRATLWLFGALGWSASWSASSILG